MAGALFFEIPDDSEIMAKLVEAVPPNWSWIDGKLCAPLDFIVLGRAAENTGFTVERFHNIHPTIVGSYDSISGSRRTPDIFAIMVEQKMPGFVLFDEAGYGASVITFELSRRIAAGFLRQGYRGGLHFYKDCFRNSKYENPARCSMVFGPWLGPPAMAEESGSQPARIKLEWDGRYRGKQEDISAIAAACRSLGLREYAPVAPEEASAP